MITEDITDLDNVKYEINQDETRTFSRNTNKENSQKSKREATVRLWEHVLAQGVSTALAYYSVTDSENIGALGSICSKLLTNASGDFKFLIPATISISAYEVYRSKGQYTKVVCIIGGVTYVLTSAMLTQLGFDAGMIGEFFYELTSKTVGTGVLNIVTTILYSSLIIPLMKRIENLNLPKIKIGKKSFNESQEIKPKLNLVKKFLTDENSDKINSLFTNFGIKANVSKVIKGNATTRYLLTYAAGTKIEKIENLRKELALELSVDTLNITTKGSDLFIEIANKNKKVITFTELIKTEKFNSENSFMLPIGESIEGNMEYFDFRKFPHIIVAGATNSGKSTFLNLVIASIMKKFSPEEVKLLLVDPKQVELAVYEDIPFLYTKIITETTEAVDALKALVMTMQERYLLLREYKEKDIIRFNKANPEKKMPYIVAIIDEFADLIMSSEKEVEDSVKSLAGMARAAGIHLILATQRPDSTVFTGIIKSNVPSRLAFTTSSGTDSRIILDQNGAENLSGNGDCLFLPMGKSNPERLQSVFISDSEIIKVVKESISCYGEYQDIYNNPKLDNINIISDYDKVSVSEHGVIDFKEKLSKMNEKRQEEKFKREIFPNKLSEQVLLWGIENREISRRKIIKEFNISDSTAKSIYGELTNLGLIKITKSRTSPDLITITLEEWEVMKKELLEQYEGEYECK